MSLSNRVISGLDLTNLQSWFSDLHPTIQWNKNPLGGGREYFPIPLTTSVPQYFFLFESFGLKPLGFVSPLNCFIGHHYEDGAFVDEHMDILPDSSPENCVHVRINVMLKKPQSGGNPVINGQEITVNEGDIWMTVVSMEKHGSTAIEGGERIVLSCGGFVDKSTLSSYISIV